KRLKFDNYVEMQKKGKNCPLSDLQLINPCLTL
ncbi:unnamed protein product, partial [marine sediment metagenome]